MLMLNKVVKEKSNNTRARVKISDGVMTISIPKKYSVQEEVAFVELCSDLPDLPIDHPTMRGRDSMNTFLVVESDSGKIKFSVERDMI